MITISDDVLQTLDASEDEVRREIGILLYRLGLPPGKAAELVGLDRAAFRDVLASRRVAVQYGPVDLDSDLATLRVVREKQQGSGGRQPGES